MNFKINLTIPFKNIKKLVGILIKIALNPQVKLEGNMLKILSLLTH